jgi:hypothetical protein
LFSSLPRSARWPVVGGSHGWRRQHSPEASRWPAMVPSQNATPFGQQDLLKLRREEAERNATAHRRVLVRLLERIKAEYDRYTAGAQKEPPGARRPDRLGRRGLGSLRGGVSQRVAQGACPAPTRQARVRRCDRGEHRHPHRAFAFLGDEPATDQIVTLYRNPEADWVKQRRMLYFLPDNISFSECPGWSARCAGT